MNKLWCVNIVAVRMKDNIRIIQSNVIIETGSEEHATGYGYKEVNRRYPKEEGWNSHTVLVSNLQKEQMLEILKKVDE